MSYSRQIILGVILACASSQSTLQAAAQAPSPVVPGDAVVEGSRVQPGTRTYRIDAQAGERTMEVGTMTQQVTATTFEGRSALLIVQTMTSRMGTGVDTAIVDAATLAPIRHRGHNAGGTLSIDFAGVKVTGSKKDSEGSAQAIDQTLTEKVFDANIMDFLVQALPLATGYSARVPLYIYERGGLVWYDVKVAGERTAEGKPAWDVELKTPEAVIHYLVDKADRANLGYEVTMATGMKMTMTRTGS